MGMKCAEEPFNMGMFYLPKVSFKMGTHTSGHFYTGVAPLGLYYELGNLVSDDRVTR